MKISIKTRFIIQHHDIVGLQNNIIGELRRLEIKNIKYEDGRIYFELKKITYGDLYFRLAIPDEGNFMIEDVAKGNLEVFYTASIIITTDVLIMTGLLLLGVLVDYSFLFGLFLFSLQETYRIIEFRKGIKKMKENILGCD